MGNKFTKQNPGSKLKKRRTQSITWNFRYSTMRRKNAAIIANEEKQDELKIKFDLSEWLRKLELSEYEKNFKNFAKIEKLLKLSESDIKSLGIKNSTHRTRIIDGLVELRDIFQKTDKTENGKLTFPKSKKAESDNSRHSIAEIGANNKKDDKNGLPSPKRQNSETSIRIKKSNMVDTSNGVKEENKTLKAESIYEVLSPENTKQSKSCGDLVDMDSTTTTPTLEIGHEALVLKKALEWELSLDSRDLRSHAWYHGAIPRQRSEEIVQKDGDFLVRDCASQPGNYVLTCKSKSVILHFVIHKILIQPETVYERVQYQFEEDAYDTVPDLITFYVGSGKPISAASGARIQYPCNRSHPLSFYGNKFIGNQLHNQIVTGIRGISPVNSPSISNLRFNPYNQQGSYNNTITTHRSPMSSPPRTKRDTPPRLPSKKHRSQSLTPLQSIHSQNGDKYCSVDGITPDKRPQSHLNNEIQKKASQSERSSSADGMIQTNGTVVNNIPKPSNEKPSSADGVIRHCNGQRAHSHSLPRPMTSSRLKMSNSRTSSLNRETSNSSLTPCAEQNKQKDEKAPSPPPKPTRPIGANINNTNNSQITSSQREKRESIKELPLEQQNPLNRVASYHASGSDSGNGSGDSAQSSAPGDLLVEAHVPHRGVIIKNPRFMTNSLSSMTLKSFNEFDIIAAEQELANMDIPIYQHVSKFDLENFNTLLLPAVENNPLDSDALNTFRIMLAETGPRIIAQHLTRIDVLLILGELDDLKTFTSDDNTDISGLKSNGKDNILFNCSGIELITLPHGEIFRNDLIERTQCIKLLVAITIMTCQNDLERAEILDKWIQIAIETKTALGNLFGFCAIMLGLCMPQIQKLEQTWHILRQKFTDSAFTFEAKLRPTLKSMNDCSNPQAPNTTVPHLLPYILLRDRTVEDILMVTTTNSKTTSNIQTVKSPQQKSSLVNSCVTNWESNADDFGISILFSHLDAARNFTKNLSLYRRNAQIVLENAKTRLDDLLSDAFRTEFHIKFLWGSKGALVSAEERHSKLEHVIGIMADKFCKTEIIGSAG